eukprot:gene14282-16891_t
MGLFRRLISGGCGVHTSARLMQTGAVLLIKLLFGSEIIAVAYATLVSIIALCLFLRFRPFKEDDDDALMQVILLNQMMCQYLLMCISLTDHGSGVLGIILVVCQVCLVSYALKLMYPGLMALASSTTRALVKLTRKISKKSKRTKNTDPSSKLSAPPSQKDTPDPITAEQASVRDDPQMPSSPSLTLDIVSHGQWAPWAMGAVGSDLDDNALDGSRDTANNFYLQDSDLVPSDDVTLAYDSNDEPAYESADQELAHKSAAFPDTAGFDVTSRL